MALPLIIAGAALMAGGIAGNRSSAGSKNKQIKKLIKNTPKYKISQEAKENQAIAKNRAFGRDRAIQQAQSDITKGAATDSMYARDSATSTSDILNTIALINANKNQSIRALAGDESQLQSQRVQELYGANSAMIDEKDKAFNQNEVAPWDANLRHLQAKKEEAASFYNNMFQSGSSMLGSGLGGGKGK
jgi:uncharacterized membrane protein YheB (UPF0754 family)